MRIALLLDCALGLGGCLSLALPEVEVEVAAERKVCIGVSVTLYRKRTLPAEEE